MARVIHADCVEAMRSMDEASVDAVVCDPPYSLGFMGRSWDSHGEHEDAGFGYYLAGLIDGEGTFRVGAGERRCEFAMKLRDDDRWILERAQSFIGHGRIGNEPRRDGSAPQARLIIDTKDGCAALCALLMRYPLRAKKLRDFLTWAEAVDEWLTMPRGNRWHGPADRARLAELGERLRSERAYSEVPWSGNAFQDWCRRWGAETLRVLKPGGHLLAFGGSRTYHRLAAGLEDAGFEIRDSLIWLYGSGFPKSLDVSKAIDKAAGARREVVGRANGAASQNTESLGPYAPEYDATIPATPEAQRWQGWGTALKPAHEPVVVARKPLSGTVAANVLEHGVGALSIDACRIGVSGQRPIMGAWESDESLCDSCAADAESGPRPTTPGTRASTAQSDAAPITNGRGEKHPAATSRTATGCSPGQNPEGRSESRTADTSSSTDTSGSRNTARSPKAAKSTTSTETGPTIGLRTCAACHSPITDESTTASPTSTPTALRRPTTSELGETSGRWPSNVTLSPEAAEELDRQSGERPGGNYPEQRGEGVATGFGAGRPTDGGPRQMGDTGGASRFFYTAKASRGERNAGLDGFEEVERGSNFGNDGARPHTAEDYEYRAKSANVHPTVKPIALMRWLVRLVTPPGGTILDPFTGSGTTGIAAHLEGFDFIGIEREAEYVEIARARIAFWAGFPVGTETQAALDSGERERAVRESGQGSLL